MIDGNLGALDILREVSVVENGAGVSIVMVEQPGERCPRPLLLLLCYFEEDGTLESRRQGKSFSNQRTGPL